MLAIAHADSGQFDDAWRCIGKAMTAMQAPERDVAKAQAYFEHSLTIARAQRAKSWELRAAMSMARPFGAIRASGMRRAIFSLRSIAGSPRASTRSI
jgi:hypothetical protein